MLDRHQKERTEKQWDRKIEAFTKHTTDREGQDDHAAECNIKASGMSDKDPYGDQDRIINTFKKTSDRFWCFIHGNTPWKVISDCPQTRLTNGIFLSSDTS